MSKASRAHRSDGAPAAGGSELGSLLLLSTVAILLSISAHTSRPFAQTPEKKESSQAENKRPQQPSLKLSSSKSSVSSCPGQEASAQVQLTASGLESASVIYNWKATGGDINGDGRFATWDLSGLKPGTYTATVKVSLPTLIANVSLSDSVKVAVVECRVPTATCPKITMYCPGEVLDERPFGVRAGVEAGGPKPRGELTHRWSLTAGSIIRGQGTPSIGINPAGLAGQKIVATYEVGGYGLKCAEFCTMSVVLPPATPTPTPTPTPTLTPTPSPSATPSASPSAIPTTSPDASSLPPTPIPSDTSDVQGAQRLWPWVLLAILAALFVGALLLAKLSSFPLLERIKSVLANLMKSSPAASPSPPTVSPDEGGMGAVIIGGQKKADEVHCTAFAPEQAAPGDTFLVQVFAHLAKQAGQLAALAAKADESARDRGSKVLSEPIERGTKLTFTLLMRGLEVSEPTQSLTWQGTVDYVQFAVDVPADFVPKDILGVVKIYCEGAPVGQIMFKFKVVEVGASQPEAASTPAPPSQKLIKYTHAFISYCSEDRRRVLMGLQGLKKGFKLAGIPYFMDMQDIESGEYWREVIQQNLDKSDLFVLFWSSAAQCSEEVSKEINYALTRKSGSDENPPFFEPFTIELPIPQPLPVGLESLHFGDDLLYIIKAEEAIEAEDAAPNAGDGQN